MNLIWNGTGRNRNAALTVFRHFDSASVVQGLVGGRPLTAWVIDYPMLERIHYLLVAGFDVFGNVGHQVLTRLYMDFLRMEGEANFLMLLPHTRRTQLAHAWYRGVTGSARQRIDAKLAGRGVESRIRYAGAQPELELFSSIEKHLASVRFCTRPRSSQTRLATELCASASVSRATTPRFGVRATRCTRRNCARDRRTADSSTTTGWTPIENRARRASAALPEPNATSATNCQNDSKRGAQSTRAATSLSKDQSSAE